MIDTRSRTRADPWGKEVTGKEEDTNRLLRIVIRILRIANEREVPLFMWLDDDSFFWDIPEIIALSPYYREVHFSNDNNPIRKVFWTNVSDGDWGFALPEGPYDLVTGGLSRWNIPRTQITKLCKDILYDIRAPLWEELRTIALRRRNGQISRQ